MGGTSSAPYKASYREEPYRQPYREVDRSPGGGGDFDVGGIRVNKCFKEFASRRESDEFVRQGRVKINGRVALMGDKVSIGDSVSLDNRPVMWESLAIADSESEAGDQYVYIKYWKPAGITCTTDTRVRGNILDRIRHPERIFPVGRLDKESTGLILLTSDGRLPNAVLRSGRKHDKTYNVVVNKVLRGEDVEQLAKGVVITTLSQRDGRSKVLTAPTMPCRVRQLSKYEIEITLVEGRNRQIRRMLEALGYAVVELHRMEVMGIGLSGIKEGQWKALGRGEMELVNKCLALAASGGMESRPDGYDDGDRFSEDDDEEDYDDDEQGVYQQEDK